MAYMRASGMGRYRFRRGLGDVKFTCADGTNVANFSDCPESGGQLQDLSPDDPILQNPYEGTTYGTRSGGSYPGALVRSGQQTFTSFLNANAGKIALAGGALFFLMVAVKR